MSDAEYSFCAAAKGETNPNQDEFEKAKTATFASLTDESELQLVKPVGAWSVARN